MSGVVLEPSRFGEDRLAQPSDLTPDALRGLSDFFEPLLPHFARETLRSGGEVRVRPGGDGSVRALYLFHPVEREASVFTRDPSIAEEFRQHRPGVALYSDFRLVADGFALRVYSGRLEEVDPGHRFSHPVRLAAPSEAAEIAALLRNVDGPVDERWIATATPGVEDCLAVDGPGELAGLGWVTRVEAQGRLHSLAVRPRYRRAGIGTDLFFARIEWLRRSGARSVVTEIAEENAGSRAIAEAGGLRAIGRIYRTTPAPPARG